IICTDQTDTNNEYFKEIVLSDYVTAVLSEDNRSLKRFVDGIDKKIIRLDDNFKPEKRNSDYLDLPEEKFTEEHFYYLQDGYAGFSDYTPLKDIEVVDTKQGIWKGNRVVEPGTNPDVMTVIYFYRRKHRQGPRMEPTEIEAMWPEMYIKDCSIMGYEFWLIPKIKMLFGYDPPSSTIIKAPMQMKKPGPFVG
ncbi:hypothetical protein LCGC14_2735660, partial [marine sediment metagenome]